MRTWQWNPLRSSRPVTKYDVNVLNFGGRYSQRVSADAGPPAREWSLDFRDTPSEVIAMEEFLDDHQGVYPFMFSDPDHGIPVPVICETHTKDVTRGSSSILKTKFMEYHG